MDRVVVVKLGGSVITDKSKPFTYRHTVASSLSRVMASSGRRLVLVHGGGSFGHSVARNHGLSSTASRSTPAAVSLTRGAMYKLNSLVCKSLREAGMNPYSYSPFDLLARTTKSFRIKWLNGLLDSRLTPVTFGDVIPESGGFRILSGDIIAEQLSSLMQAERCVFAMDVEGVYRDLQSKELVRELAPSNVSSLRLEKVHDATGGIHLKLRAALRMASNGTEVDFVSGFKPKEFAKALKALSFRGTRVKVSQT